MISVVGGIEVDAAVELIGARFSGGVADPLGDGPQRDAPPPKSQQLRRELDKQQCHIIIGSMGTTLDHGDRFALEVLTTVLSGQSGRLFRDLRDRQSLAYSVSSSSLEGLDPGHILVHMGTSPDKVERALEGIYGHLEQLRGEDVTPEEMQRAKQYLNRYPRHRPAAGWRSRHEHGPI